MLLFLPYCNPSCCPLASPLLHKRLTSLLTNLAYQPPHNLAYQPPHQPPLPTSSPTSLPATYQPSHQPLPLAISKMECKAKDHVYIWGLYPTIREGSLSLLLILSSSHQAQNIITKPLIAPSSDIS